MTTSRREFLKIFSSLPLAAASTLPVTPPARLMLNRFSIAGFQYCDGPVLVHRLRPGQELGYAMDFGPLRTGAHLVLTREPENPHDPFAVAIRLGRAKLGYVSRSDNKHLSRPLEQGAKLVCRVIDIDPEAGVWNMVRVEVWMIL